MKTIPVIASILEANALIPLLINAYGFREDCRCTLVRTGMNHSYEIQNGPTRYMLRVYSYQWRSLKEITAELELLIHLQKTGLSVSYPIEDAQGGYIQAWQAPEGLRYAVLFSFAEGEKLRFISKDICATIGQWMAEFHLAGKDYGTARITYNAETLLKKPYREATAFFSEDLEEMQYIDQTIQAIEQRLGAAQHELPKGCVHVDIWYDNMSIHRDEVTLFDFDFCGRGWWILDLAYFAKQLFHIEVDKKVYEDKLAAFLQGYQQHRPLTETELQLLPAAGTALWIFYLGVQAKRFDWSNIFLSENYLKMYVGRMKSWNEYHERSSTSLAPTE